MAHGKDYVKKLLNALSFKSISGALGIYEKVYSSTDKIVVDINNQSIKYPQSMTVGRNTILNFKKDENFVVLECVDQLLSLGYNSSAIALEKSYRGGWIDILIFLEGCSNLGESGQFALIECKTIKQFDKAQDKLSSEETKAAQLFDYAQQYKSVQKLCLYASEYIGDRISHSILVIPITEKMRAATNANEIREAWNGIGYESGLFDIAPYDMNEKALTYANLTEINNIAGKKLYNDFATILRKFVVSDKSNAYNKLFNLFLCKIVDEDFSDKETQPILRFQCLPNESNVDFMKKLNDLYKVGVKQYLQRDITDYSDDDFYGCAGDNIALKRMFDELRLFKNSEFSFIEVYNEKSFNENTEIVKEIVKLLQGKKLKYTHKQPYLGLFFENLLNSGFKQESGQYFTPIPIARFIVSSIPVKRIFDKKIKSGDIDFLPYIIDYACGSGHFLTEGMDEIQSIINNYPKNQLSNTQLKKLNAYKDSEYSWAKEFVYGIDLDYRLVKTTKVNTFLNGDGEANIIHANGLASFNSDEYTSKLKAQSNSIESFDILLANPPYSVKDFKKTIQNGVQRFQLFAHLGKDSDDIECLFIERMNQLLKKGAYVGIVLPTTLLESTKSHMYARKYMLDNFRFVGLVKLSDQAFMKTDTKTVVLFLEKVGNSNNDNLKKRIDLFFNDINHSDFNWESIENSIESFAAECRGMALSDYISTISKDVSCADLEKEQIYIYIKTRSQRVVVVDVGEKEEAKEFLGYDFTTRRGKEGIQEKYIDSNDHEIDTKLFSNNMLDEEKVNNYIYRNFLNEPNLVVSSKLEKNINICNLSELIPFETDKGVFNAFILMNKPELDECLQVNTSHQLLSIREIMPNSVKKGTSITKKDAISGNIPVIGGGKKSAYTHNIHNRDAGVITISASGANAGFVNYHDYEIFASDCNTIQHSDKELLKYVYYYLQWKQNDIYKFARGTAQPHFYEPQIYRLMVPFPDDRQIISTIVKSCTEIDLDETKKEEYKLKEKRKVIEKLLDIRS